MTMTATQKQQFEVKWLSMTASWGQVVTAPQIDTVEQFLTSYIGEFDACILANNILFCGDESKAGKLCKKKLGHGWNLLSWAGEVKRAEFKVRQLSEVVWQNLVAWGKCRFFDPENPSSSADKTVFEEFNEFTFDPAVKLAKEAATALKPVGIGAVVLIAIGVVVYAATR
tara:strand:+ start:813 stop:1322 length:510 start_codon:yes stop_codon:yes gene_type:complete